MKKQYMPAVIVCVLILLLAAAGVGIHVVKKYIPTKERMDLNEYYGKTAEGESVIEMGTFPQYQYPHTHLHVTLRLAVL